MAHQYNFTKHMKELRLHKSKKKIVEDYERNHGKMPNKFEDTICYKLYINKFMDLVDLNDFFINQGQESYFDWKLLYLLYWSSTDINYSIETIKDGKIDIITEQNEGGTVNYLNKLTPSEIIKIFKERIEEHLRQQNIVDNQENDYQTIIQKREKVLLQKQNEKRSKPIVENISKIFEEKHGNDILLNYKKKRKKTSSKAKGLFDFEVFIIELRNNEDKKEIVNNYEKYYGLMPSSFEETECFKTYLSKFVPFYKDANISLPEDLEDDFDWPLLFCLIAGSFSSTYEIKRPNKIFIESEEKNELIITVSSGNEKVTKTLSELWSFQILRLFEIYIEEHLQICCLFKDAEESGIIIKETENKITIANKIVNDSSYEKEIPYEEEMLYHYTSIKSFKSILSSNTLWATNLEDEYDCWLECFLQVYDNLCLKDDCHTYIQLLDVIKKNVIDYFEKYKIYITCFCMKPDLREAWRRYTKSGSGICIGFNLKELNYDLYKNEHKIDLDLGNGKVEYNHNRVFNDVNEKIKKVLIDFKDSKLQYDDYIINADKLKILEECYLRSFLRLQDIKDISTIKDKEFRYYWFNPKQDPSKEVRYFAKGSSLVQYVELGTGEKKLPIKEIIIGPAYHKSNEVESLIKEQLKSFGFEVESVKISHSEVNTFLMD